MQDLSQHDARNYKEKTMANKRREDWIDCLKCIAILIVMMNHLGLTIPGFSFWGGMFFVPIFFLLSGYTYHTKEEPFGTFLKRKAKRLLLPYVTANAVLFVFFFVKDCILGNISTAEGLKNLYGIFYARNQLLSWDVQTLFLPKMDRNVYLMTILNSPTWFLMALFLTIILFEILLRLTDKNGRRMWFIAGLFLLLGILYRYLFPVLLPWSLDAVPFFLLFFMTGYFIRRKAMLYYLDRHKITLVIILALLIVCGIWNGSANFSIASYGKSIILALYNAAASSVLAMYVGFKLKKHIWKGFALVGRQTLVLLCYHMFLFAILETVWPGIPKLLELIVGTVLLTAAGYGKEKLYAKKQGS